MGPHAGGGSPSVNLAPAASRALRIADFGAAREDVIYSHRAALAMVRRGERPLARLSARSGLLGERIARAPLACDCL
jgi:hypothetical protein